MSLIYNKTAWKDDKTTPVNAKNLNNIEDGIEYVYHKWDKIIQDSTTGDHAAELIDARYGLNDTEEHPTLGHRLNHMDNKFQDIRSQLEHNTHEVYNKIRINTSERLYSSPVVTFVDDDGTSNFLTLTKPIFDKYGIKASIGVIPSKVDTKGYMTLDELKSLQDDGYSMLSHSYTHDANIYKPSVVDANPISDNVILEDYRKCYEYMVKNNFNGADTIVYPWGGFTNSGRYKNLARTYFNNGLNAGDGGINNELNDNMYLNRLFINKNTNIQTYKTAIDNIVTSGGWLILGSHSNTNEIDISHLEEIINYIKSKNILILPFNQANRLKGNAINIGDYTNDIKFFVSRRGKTSLETNVVKDNYECVGKGDYTCSSSNIKTNNNVTCVNIKLENSNGVGSFTNQTEIATITGSLPRLPFTSIFPCVITTYDSKVIMSACSINQTTTTTTINCHGTIEANNIRRIDISFNYIV